MRKKETKIEFFGGAGHSVFEELRKWVFQKGSPPKEFFLEGEIDGKSFSSKLPSLIEEIEEDLLKEAIKSHFF